MCAEQCFNYRHEHNAARAHHKSERLVTMCVECERRAVQWRCDYCLDVYCTVCFKRTHAKGTLARHTYTALPYYPAPLGLAQVRHRSWLVQRLRRRWQCMFAVHPHASR